MSERQESLEEARQWLRERVRDGAKCPCCTQFAKVYRRKLNSGMAYSLIRMYRTNGVGYVDIQANVHSKSGDTAKLRYWGLIEAHPEKRGLWRVTNLGEMFVRGLTTVLSHAELYDDRLLRLDGDAIDIRQALGNKFDYYELMDA